MRLLLFAAALLSAANLVVARPSSPLHFEENVGQADPKVAFMARTGQATLFLTSDETLYTLRGVGNREAQVRITYPKGKKGSGWQGEARQNLHLSSYVGNQDRWRSAIPSFGRAIRREIYEGIDLVYYGSAQELEYDFLVHPGAKPQDIRLHFSGVKQARINSAGDLELATEAGCLVQKRPRLFQEGKQIDGSFLLHGPNEVGFSVGHYDATKELRIDPVVSFANFYGGASTDAITAGSGATFSGYTNSIVFPGTNSNGAGGYDAFLLSLGPVHRLVFVGGSGDDRGLGLWVNPRANVFGQLQGADAIALVGETESRDFPRFYSEIRNQQRSIYVPNPDSSSFSGPFVSVFQNTFAGGRTDGFLFFLNPLGETFSCLIGGNGDDRLLGVNDGNFELDLVGDTDSTDLTLLGLPLPAAPQHKGGRDGFYAKLFHGNVNALRWRYLQYWGGSGEDSLNSVTRWAGLTLIAGTTDSDNLPVPQALQPRRGGGKDAFLMLAQSFDGLPLTGTYFGGSGDETVAGISAEQTLEGIMLAGATTSRDLPVLQASQAAFAGGESDAFWANFAGETIGRLQLRQASYWGGSGDDKALGISAEVSNGAALLTGSTNSPNFPLVAPVQSVFGGGNSDAWMAQITRGQGVRFSTYYGGSGDEEGRGIGTSFTGTIVVGGTSTSPRLPGLELSRGNAFGGGTDAFIAELASDLLTVSGANQLGKDAVVNWVLSAATPARKETRLRISSSDPSKLRVSLQPTLIGEASVETTWNGGAMQFSLHGITDTGEADLIVSGDGLQEWRETISLRPLAFFTSFTGRNLVSSSNLNRLTWKHDPASALSVFLTARVAGAPPGSVLQIFPRPGLPPLPIAVTSKDPTIIEPTLLVRNINNLGSGVSMVANLRSLALGSTDVAVRVGDYPELVTGIDVQKLRVFVPATAPLLAAANHSVLLRLAVDGQITFPFNAPIVRLVATNSATALSAFTEAAPQTSISVDMSTGNAGFIVHHLGGTDPVSFRVEHDGESTEYVLPLGAPVLNTFITGSTVGTNTGSSLSLLLPLQPPSNLPLSVFARQPVRLRLTNHNPELVKLDRDEVVVAAGSQSGPFNFQMLAVGIANITASVIDGIEAPPYSFTLGARSLQAQEILLPQLFTDGKLGKDLQQPVQIQLPRNFSVPLTITSSDPSRLLLSTTPSEMGSGQLRLTGARTGAFVYAQAVSGEGSATITVAADGYPADQKSVQLLASRLGFDDSSQSSTSNFTEESLVVGTVSLKQEEGVRNYWPLSSGAPISGLDLVLGRKTLRPGVTLRFDVTSSDASLGSLFIRNDLVYLRPAKTGETTLHLTSKEFPVNEASSTKTVRLANEPFFISWPAAPLGKDLSRIVSIGYGDRRPGAPRTYTFVSSDPTKVLLNGAASLTIREPFDVRVDALSDAGSVSVKVSDGTQESSFVVNLTRSRLVFWNIGPTGQVKTDQFLGQSVFLFVGLQAEGPEVRDLLRPGAAPIRFAIESSDARVIAPLAETLLPSAGNLSLGLATLATGSTRLRLVTAPENAGLLRGDEVFDVSVRLPKLLAAPPTLAKGTFTNFTFGFEGENAPRGPIMVVSSNPTKLRLSAASTNDLASSPGQESLAVSALQRTLLLRAYDHEGPVSLTISADGFASVTVPVTLRKAAVAISSEAGGEIRLLRSDAPVQVNAFYNANGGVDPQGSPVRLRLVSDDPSMVAVVTSEINFPSQQGFTIRALRGGRTVLRLVSLDPGTEVSATTGSLFVRVNLPTFSLSSFERLGKDSLVSVRVNSGSNVPIPVKVTSGDPSRLLIATSIAGAGAGTVTTNTGEFFLQVLGSSGRVEVLVEAEGYADQLREVTLFPSALVFVGQSQLAIEYDQVTTFDVGLIAVDESTREAVSSTQAIRPGVTINGSFEGTDLTILALDKRAFTLNNVAPTVSVQARGIRAGTVRLSLVQPPGLVDPLRFATLSVSVRAKVAVVMPREMGRNLVYAAALQFTGGPPIPVKVRVSDPSQLLLSATANESPSSELVTSTGQFFLHVLSANGIASVIVSNAESVYQESYAALRPLGVALGDTPVASLPVGGTARPSLRVIPLRADLSPAFMDSVVSFRPGISITCRAGSSDETVLNVSGGSVVLSGTTFSLPFTINGLKAGRVALMSACDQNVTSNPQSAVEIRVGTFGLPGPSAVK